MDGYLLKNLTKAKEVVKKNWDMIFVVDGYEGSGKTVLAQQCAVTVDPTFDIDRLVFNPDDFKDAINDAKQYQAVIYDEAYGGLSSKSAMSLVNKSIVQMLTVIRSRNLFVFIVLPTFFDLDKYVALWRSRALLHVYTGDDFERGFFRFYNIDRKKDMYVKGKKFYTYNFRGSNFHGRFTNHWVVNEKHYEKKKNETSLKIADEQEHINTKIMNIRSEITRRLIDFFPTLKNKEVSKIIGVERHCISKYKVMEDGR